MPRLQWRSADSARRILGTWQRNLERCARWDTTHPRPQQNTASDARALLSCANKPKRWATSQACSAQCSPRTNSCVFRQFCWQLSAATGFKDRTWAHISSAAATISARCRCSTSACCGSLTSRAAALWHGVERDVLRTEGGIRLWSTETAPPGSALRPTVTSAARTAWMRSLAAKAVDTVSWSATSGDISSPGKVNHSAHTTHATETGSRSRQQFARNVQPTHRTRQRPACLSPGCAGPLQKSLGSLRAETRHSHCAREGELLQ